MGGEKEEKKRRIRTRERKQGSVYNTKSIYYTGTTVLLFYCTLLYSFRFVADSNLTLVYLEYVLSAQGLGTLERR